MYIVNVYCIHIRKLRQLLSIFVKRRIDFQAKENILFDTIKKEDNIIL